jgi:hypothetical protein
MGFACAWIAVKGKSPEDVLKEFDLNRTGEFEETFDSDYNATKRGQWYILIANRDGVIPLLKADAYRLSRNCEMVFCQVEDHVMYSSASYWVDGTNKFFVSHNSDKGETNLEEKGSFPAQYDEIRARLIGEQKKEDSKRSSGDTESMQFPVDYIFDIPVELAKSLTGFRHDDWSEDETPFEILQKKPASLLKRMFGKS